MDFSSPKKEQKELIKDILINYIYDNKSLIFYDEVKIKTIMQEYINKIKLTALDYEDITKETINYLRIKKVFHNIDETQNILEIMSTKHPNYHIEYSKDDTDIYLYFKLENNHTYLINHDSINKNWYISLLETNSLELIEEIYSDRYNNFIIFLKEKVAR